MTSTRRSSASAVVAMLGEHIDPARIVAAAPELDAAARVWNGAVDHRPALVVRCETTGEVRHAVRCSAAGGLALSVRGGGHDWAGRALRTGGVVIDLSGMREVSVREVSARGGIATVAGGATSAEVATAADRHGLAAATGTVGDVGMVGLSLAGGYGPYCGRFGLAADNVLAAQVVLADGRVVRADADPEAGDPELLWALRGGGGNFGVVTAVEVALHPLVAVLAGSFTFPGEQARQVLTGYGELVARAPDELGSIVTLVTGADGTPAVVVSPTWSGELTEGRAILAEFAALGTPVAQDVSVLSPLTKLRQFDGAFPAGAHYLIRTRNVAVLTPDAVSTLLESYAARPSAGSFINIHHFHGAASRRSVASTAFGQRAEHLMVEIIETGASVTGTWTSSASSALARHALPGGYPNLLGPDDERQIAAAYGANAPRLLAVKDRLDPHGVFTATPLPPRTHAAVR